MYRVKNVTPNSKEGSSLCGKTSLILSSSISDKLRHALQLKTWTAACWCVRSVWVIPFLLTMAFDWVETIVRWVMAQICIGYSSQNFWDWSALCLYQFDPRYPLAKSPMSPTTNQFTHSAVNQKCLELVPPRSNHQQSNLCAFKPSQSKHGKVSALPPESLACAVSGHHESLATVFMTLIWGSAILAAWEKTYLCQERVFFWLFLFVELKILNSMVPLHFGDLSSRFGCWMVHWLKHVCLHYKY